jgi:hypothetical protein
MNVTGNCFCVSKLCVRVLMYFVHLEIYSYYCKLNYDLNNTSKCEKKTLYYLPLGLPRLDVIIRITMINLAINNERSGSFDGIRI